MSDLTDTEIELLIDWGKSNPEAARESIMPPYAVSGKTAVFMNLVRAMRKAQKEYFSSKSKEALQRSIGLERQIDRILGQE